jgi:hypothetical protein
LRSKFATGETVLVTLDDSGEVVLQHVQPPKKEKAAREPKEPKEPAATAGSQATAKKTEPTT